MKLLLAVDGSSASLHAVQHALKLTQEGLQADFVLANVQEPASLYEVVTAHDPDVIREVRGAAGADLLKDAEAMLDAAGLGYEREVAGGDPAHMLVEIVHAVLNASQMPVTVVRMPDEGDDDESQA